MRYKKLYPAVICFCVFLAAIGLVLGDPSTVLPGLWKIIVTEDALITDYVKIAGVSAALVNSALVTLVSLLLLYLSKEPPNGFTLVELGLMAGFSLFGKNIVNIWPIIAGTFLYAKARREPFGKYVSVSLLATALAPVVSYVALDNGFGNLWWGIAVGLLIGFPLGAMTSEAKAFECRDAIEKGADEIDMVINIGGVKDGDHDGVVRDIKMVREAAGAHTLKVIIETCLLSDEEKVFACKACMEAGADFVKTSTGFSTSGATVEDVRLMKQTVGDVCQVKAAGGVRSFDDLKAMIEAGADRIGTSSGVALLAGQEAAGY